MALEASRDAPPPRAGPPFLRLDGWPYRLEMATAGIAVLVLLFYWRWWAVGDLDLALTVFWLVWPDLVAFLPIGVAGRGRPSWPSWGPTLYDASHSYLVWLAVFVPWSLWAGGVVWPLLGWVGHIAVDRAVGYYLRAPTRKG